jgi:para-nitrobenzyl esterase
VLSGNMHDENRLWMVAFNNGDISAPYYQQLVTSLAPNSPATAQRLLAAYPATTDGSPTLAWGAATTDRIWSCTQVTTDDALARAVPVYAFDFDDQNSPIIAYQKLPFPGGAAHAAELPYLFEPGGHRLPMSPAQQQLSGQMISYWTNFARTGNPNGPGLTAWNRVGHGRADATNGLRLAPSDAAGTGSENIAAEHHCGLWASIR